MTVIDEYLSNVTPAQRALVERIRTIVKQEVPDAEEAISYHLPAFKYKKKYLLGIGVFKKHMTLFPGTVKFTEDEPLPEALIRDFVAERVRAVSAGE